MHAMAPNSSSSSSSQHGYHHRTEVNKKIYRVGKKGDNKSASTEADLTE